MGRIVVPTDSPQRTAPPLPALTADQAISQLIWRVLGPYPDRVHPMLAWSAGNEAPPGDDITAAHLQYLISRVQAIGRCTPLQPTVLAELQTPGTRDVRRHRARRLFALPTPPAPATPSAYPPRWAHGLRVNTRTAVRVLAAVGPLPMIDLHLAVARTHRQRSTWLPTAAELATGLAYIGGAHDPHTDRWSPPTGATPWPRDIKLLEVDKELNSPLYNRRQLVELLAAAGYDHITPHSNTIARHPLIRQAARNQYRLSPRTVL